MINKEILNKKEEKQKLVNMFKLIIAVVIKMELSVLY